MGLSKNSKKKKKKLTENDKFIHKSQHSCNGLLVLSKRQNCNAGFDLYYWRAVLEFSVIYSFLSNFKPGQKGIQVSSLLSFSNP